VAVSKNTTRDSRRSWLPFIGIAVALLFIYQGPYTRPWLGSRNIDRPIEIIVKVKGEHPVERRLTDPESLDWLAKKIRTSPDSHYWGRHIDFELIFSRGRSSSVEAATWNGRSLGLSVSESFLTGIGIYDPEYFGIEISASAPEPLRKLFDGLD
jgi:hypothetical protein